MKKIRTWLDFFTLIFRFGTVFNVLITLRGGGEIRPHNLSEPAGGSGEVEAFRATEGQEWEDAFRLTISKEGVCWGLERIAAASLDQKAAVFLWTVLQASPSTHWNLDVETEFLDPQGGGCWESLGRVMPSASTRAVLL